MKSLSILLILLLIPGCSLMQPRGNIDMSFAEECKTVECVVDKVDSIANDERYPGKRFKVMEGYRDVPLKTLREMGKLDIDTMDPILFTFLFSTGFLVLGYTVLEFGEYGDVASCKVRYVPSPGWTMLVHELTHCQGYSDSGFWNGRGPYTPSQERIIKEEGVDSWTSSEFYKNGKYKIKGYIEN